MKFSHKLLNSNKIIVYLTIFVCSLLFLLQWWRGFEFTSSPKNTIKMDSHCFQLEHGKVPIVFFVWGKSLDLASSVFELFQKAECPRRLKVFALEHYTSGRYAASYYEELQRFHGLQDTPFLEQISWILLDIEDSKALRPLINLHQLIHGPNFVERDLPLGVLLKAKESFLLKKNYDGPLLEKSSMLLKEGRPMELFTATANTFSRIHTEKGPPHIEWISIFGNHSKVSVSFPSTFIFGPMKTILTQIDTMHSEWPQIADEAFFFLSGLSSHVFSFFGCDILESMESLQKLSSKIAKELTARYPAQTSLVSENHVLGLDSSCSKWEIIAKQKSMRDYENNLNQIRKM